MNKYTKLIKTALYWAELASENKSVILRKYPSAIYIDNKKTDTQGFMLHKDEVLVVAFRGTQQSRDWITDFRAWHTVVPYGNYESDIRVHNGFITAYKSVREQIQKYITDRTDKPGVCGSVCGKAVCGSTTNKIRKVLICGHSLGGALATLCAVDVQYNFPNLEIECYPTGNPSVGNKAFAKSYNKRVPNTVRTYMRTDLVPYLPPHWLEKSCGGYKHTDKPNPIGPRNIFIGLKIWFKRNFKTDNFAAELTNHSIELYLKYC